MNTRHTLRSFLATLFAALLAVPFVYHGTAAQSTENGKGKADVKTENGLTRVTFTFDIGKVLVNLPDDIMAGDTISGTVVAEPSGKTADERAKNQDVLNGEIIEIKGGSFQGGQPVDHDVVFLERAVGSPHPLTAQMATTESPGVAGFSIALKSSNQASGQELARALIRIYSFDELPGLTPSGALIHPDPKITQPFIIPRLGQTGRPIVITGPFDGNSSNTHLDLTAPKTTLQNSGKNTENVSGGFHLIAESPRRAVFESPNDVTGPVEIVLKEGNQETKGTFRNVKVDLTAPKTSLLKGESTELHVEVSGLEGLTQPVPLTLESHGVITMEGGMYQPLVIQPSQVGPDGRFTTTRGITGVQTGGWMATGTVVTHRFDACLQDDTAPARRILWNTFNGDYIFVCPGCWPPKGQQGGATGTTGGSGGTKTGGTFESGGTTVGATVGRSIDPLGGLSGKGTITMKGCVFTLEHNLPDRRVLSTIDPCAQTGSASVQTSLRNSPKVKFTITDRSTTDNTCAVQ